MGTRPFLAAVSMKQSRTFAIYARALLIPSVLALTVAACAGDADSYSLLEIGDQVPAYGAALCSCSPKHQNRAQIHVSLPPFPHHTRPKKGTSPGS